MGPIKSTASMEQSSRLTIHRIMINLISRRQLRRWCDAEGMIGRPLMEHRHCISPRHVFKLQDLHFLNCSNCVLNAYSSLTTETSFFWLASSSCSSLYLMWQINSFTRSNPNVPFREISEVIIIITDFSVYMKLLLLRDKPSSRTRMKPLI